MNIYMQTKMRSRKKNTHQRKKKKTRSTKNYTRRFLKKKNTVLTNQKGGGPIWSINQDKWINKKTKNQTSTDYSFYEAKILNSLGIRPITPKNGNIEGLAQWFSNPNSAGNFNMSLNESLKSKSSLQIKKIIIVIQESMNLRIKDQMTHLKNKTDLTSHQSKYEGHREFINALFHALKTAVKTRHQKKKSKQKLHDTIETIIRQNKSNRAAADAADAAEAAEAAEADAEQDSGDISELNDLLNKLSLE